MNKTLKQLLVLTLACVTLCGTAVAAPRGGKGHAPAPAPRHQTAKRVPPARHHTPKRHNHHRPAPKTRHHGHHNVHHHHHNHNNGWATFGAAVVGGLVGNLLGTCL